jgi:hypothetical protein
VSHNYHPTQRKVKMMLEDDPSLEHIFVDKSEATCESPKFRPSPRNNRRLRQVTHTDLDHWIDDIAIEDEYRLNNSQDVTQSVEISTSNNKTERRRQLLKILDLFEDAETALDSDFGILVSENSQNPSETAFDSDSGILVSESSQKPSELEARSRDTFFYSFVSNIFFLFGSVIFLWGAVADLQWYKLVADIPYSVLAADDDEMWYLYNAAKEQDASIPDYVADTDDDEVRKVWESYAALQFPRATDEGLEQYHNPLGVTVDTYLFQYALLYFAACCCFCIVGVVEWFKLQYSLPRDVVCFPLRQKQRKYILLSTVSMGFAGLMGMGAALAAESEIIVLDYCPLSDLCIILSTHGFFVYAVIITITRNHALEGSLSVKSPIYLYMLWLADAFFSVGSIINIVLGYIHLFSDHPNHQLDLKTKNESVHLCRLEVYSACLWVACALIYNYTAISVYCRSALPAKCRAANLELSLKMDDTTLSTDA